VFVEDRAPFFFRLEVNEIFGVEETGIVRSIVRAADLAGALRNFGKRAKHDARLIGDANALVGPRAWSERTAHPERAFVQMRKKFRSDEAAKGENIPQHDTQHT